MTTGPEITRCASYSRSRDHTRSAIYVYDDQSSPRQSIQHTQPDFYYGFRYYSPELGRWLSKDPIGISGGLNQYAFVGNNPINYVDPSGLEEEEPELGEGPGFGPGWDPTVPPGPGWEWRGAPGSVPGDGRGNWYNPGTGDSLHPDLKHPEGIPPHWDYHPNGGPKVRVDPDSGQPLEYIAVGGAVVAGAVIIKKVVGGILILAPEPITTATGVGLVVTP